MLIACPHCTSVNRVPDARTTDDPVCGRCGQPLLSGEIVVLTDANFDAIAAPTELPVVVDFWAQWCGPCHMMAPEIEKVAQRTGGRALVLKVDTDANPELSQRYQIRSIPTIAIFLDGREATRAAGVQPAANIEQLIARHTSV